MDSTFSFSKAWFIVSLLVLSFGYGFASHAWNLFPKTFLERSWEQAKRLTGAAPPSLQTTLQSRVYPEGGTRIVEEEEMQPGLTLITSWWDGSKGARLIDERGNVLHQWSVSGGDIVPDSINVASNPDARVIHGTYLFPNGDLLLNIEYTGTARIDACGKVRWQVLETTHHSIARSHDGSFWIPAVNTNPETPKTFPGLGEVSSPEQILKVSQNGAVTDQINVLNILYENDLDRYLVRFDEEIHLNDVEPLPASLANEYPLFEAGDLIVSLRDANLVFVFNPKTGVVKWHASRPFIAQHDPDFIGDGWIGIFDNRKDFTERGEMLGGSRIVAIQPHTDSTKILFPTKKSAPFHTKLRGKWQMLKNGNMLLTEAQAGRVVEVAPDGRTIWEWIHEPYSKTKVPAVTEATRYDLSRRHVASWPCSSVDSAGTSN